MIDIAAAQDTLSQFENMKLKKDVAYMICKITKKAKPAKGKEISVEKIVLKKDCPKEDRLNNFITEVKAAGVRFAVVDNNNKLLFVHWSPDTGKAKAKMEYSSCKEAFINSLVGIQIKLQANDDGDLTPEIIQEKTKSKV